MHLEHDLVGMIILGFKELFRVIDKDEMGGGSRRSVVHIGCNLQGRIGRDKALGMHLTQQLSDRCGSIVECCSSSCGGGGCVRQKSEMIEHMKCGDTPLLQPNKNKKQRETTYG